MATVTNAVYIYKELLHFVKGEGDDIKPNIIAWVAQ
jgi:hypothetical protein